VGRSYFTPFVTNPQKPMRGQLGLQAGNKSCGARKRQGRIVTTDRRKSAGAIPRCCFVVLSPLLVVALALAIKRLGVFAVKSKAVQTRKDQDHAENHTSSP